MFSSIMLRKFFSLNQITLQEIVEKGKKISAIEH